MRGHVAGNHVFVASRGEGLSRSELTRKLLKYNDTDFAHFSEYASILQKK